MSEKLPPIIVENESVRCTASRHYWPADYSYGDTCDCGRFYLMEDNGGVKVEETNVE